MIKDVTTCMGYQQINGAAASTALTIPSVDPVTGLSAMPTHAVIVVEAQTVRWRDDGTNPTAAIGMPLTPGSIFIYDGDLRRIRFIQAAATAVINVTYYK